MIAKELEKYNDFIIKNKYTFVQVIENENFPIIEYKKRNVPYVIKVLDSTNKSTVIQTIILNEIKINEHLTKVVTKSDKKYIMVAEILFDENTGVFYIIMERMKGTLHDINNKTFIKNCNKIIYKILKCINMLHKYGVIHSDLKPDNIFYKIHMGGVVLKLGDFGLSNFIDSKDVISGPYVPDDLMISESKYDNRRIDYWQLAIMIYCMFTKNQNKFYKKKLIDTKIIYKMFEKMENKELSKFLLSCLEKCKHPDSNVAMHLHEYIIAD